MRFGRLERMEKNVIRERDNYDYYPDSSREAAELPWCDEETQRKLDELFGDDQLPFGFRTSERV